MQAQNQERSFLEKLYSMYNDPDKNVKPGASGFDILDAMAAEIRGRLDQEPNIGQELAVHQPECLAVFEKHYVQLPLLKGDAVFFNPALIHAAGNNRTANIRRTANLLQVSSAFGRAMETVNRERMSAVNS